MIYQKKLETRYKTDILIVGGGAVGVAAAVAAATAVESGNVRHISVPALQRTLLEKGAYLRESVAASF